MALLSSETKRTLIENDRRWLIQFAIRAVATLFAFISIVIFAATVARSKATYGGNDWTDGFPIGPLLIAFLYNTFFLISVLFVRHGHYIHPGWSVTADLFVWALAVPAILFSVGDGWFWWWQPVRFRFRSGFVPCRSFNFWSKPCQPLIYELGKQEIGANVFLALVLIMHFGLFVRACILCHRYRKQSKSRSAAARNIQLQYHRDPVEHEQERPPAYERSSNTAPSVQTDRLSTVASPVSPVSTMSREEHAAKFA